MIKFSDNHITGIPEIDDQHQRLFDTIHNIYKDIVEYDAKNIDRYLVDLIAYSTFHIRTENKYLEEYITLYHNDKALCDEIRAHILDHKYFPEFIMTQLEKHSLQRDLSKPYFLVDIAIFLNKWIDEHILKHDKLLFSELKRQRI